MIVQNLEAISVPDGRFELFGEPGISEHLDGNVKGDFEVANGIFEIAAFLAVLDGGDSDLFGGEWHVRLSLEGEWLRSFLPKRKRTKDKADRQSRISVVYGLGVSGARQAGLLV